MEIPSSLSFYSGNPRAKNNIGVVIHGTNSQAINMYKLADALSDYTDFEAIYVFDDWGYFSMVNPSISWVDALDFIGPKGWLRFLSRKVAEIIATPSFAVETAAQRIASEVRINKFNNVSLIGHSLGGLVARCALETYDLRREVRSVITLGSPHYAWHKSHYPYLWKENPFKDYPYLFILGGADAICTNRYMGNITRKNDHLIKGLSKVIIPGHGHSSIHEEAASNYVTELINHFHKKKSLAGTSEFSVVEFDDGESLFYSDEISEISEKKHSPSLYSDWLEFAYKEDLILE